jgi:hypothetical protein
MLGSGRGHRHRIRSIRGGRIPSGSIGKGEERSLFRATGGGIRSRSVKVGETLKRVSVEKEDAVQGQVTHYILI